MKKRYSAVFLVLSLVLCLTLAAPVFAETKNVVMKIGDPYLTVDGAKQEIDPGRGTKPVIVNKRTLVPIRALVEAMGGTVAWNADEQKVTLSLMDNTMELWIDKTATKVNGVDKDTDVAPKVMNSRTMLPARFVVENLLPGSEVGWDGATQTIPITFDRATDFDLIAKSADRFLNAATFAATVEPDAVKADPSKYFLLSIQSAEDFAKGHVPGAINVPFKQVAKKENLAKLPTNKKIVVICYTGHTASYTAMFLNQLGYDASVLKFGTMGWNDKNAGMGTVKPYAGSKNFAVETTAVAATTNELPASTTTTAPVNDAIIAATDAFLNSGKPATVEPDAVKADPSKYFLLSIQSADDYAKGHVPGAINIGFKAIAKKDNLKKLPKDKQIVVICYTGHTASYTAMLLNQLGYNATVLKFGTMGWNDQTAGMGAVKPYAGSKGFDVQSANVVNEAPMIMSAADKFLNSTGFAATIEPDVVKKNPSDFFLLSLQSAEDFAKGHVPGAINIPFKQVAKKENLAKLPKDKKIVVICYTGHTASYTAMFLNQLGYEATVLKFGTMGWNDQTAGMGAVKPYAGSKGFDVETTAVAAAATNAMPTVATGFKTADDIIIAATDAFLNSGKPATVEPDAVKAKPQDYFLLSIQSADDYAKGHVPGAINFGFKNIAKEENLKKLPKDKKIVVICYTGHTASYTAMLLNQLGYDATVLKFGTMGWNDQTAGMGTVKPYAGSKGFPVE